MQYYIVYCEAVILVYIPIILKQAELAAIKLPRPFQKSIINVDYY